MGLAVPGSALHYTCTAVTYFKAIIVDKYNVLIEAVQCFLMWKPPQLSKDFNIDRVPQNYMALAPLLEELKVIDDNNKNVEKNISSMVNAF